MTPKRVFILLVLLFVTVNIFAFNWPDFFISTGGGGHLGYTFVRYKLNAGGVKSIQDLDRFNAGAFAFADFTYAKLSISYHYGIGSYSERIHHGGTPIITSGIGQEMSLGISILLKYPFNINDRLKWFPLLGVEYEIALQQLRKPNDGIYKGYTVDRTDGRLMEDNLRGKPYSISMWNSWNIILGAGTDFFLTDKLFLRGEFLFGFRMPTGYELDVLDIMEDALGKAKLGGINGSPTLRISVGYRFPAFSSKRKEAADIVEEIIYIPEQVAEVPEQITEEREQVAVIPEQITEDSEIKIIESDPSDETVIYVSDLIKTEEDKDYGITVIRDEEENVRTQVPSIIFRANYADFAMLSGEIYEDNSRILDIIADMVNNMEDYNVLVEGHTNATTPRGPARTREERALMALGEYRARRVVDELAARGVDRSRLSYVGVGAARMIAPWNDIENNYQNDRIDIILIPKEKDNDQY